MNLNNEKKRTASAWIGCLTSVSFYNLDIAMLPEQDLVCKYIYKSAKQMGQSVQVYVSIHLKAAHHLVVQQVSGLQ